MKKALTFLFLAILGSVIGFRASIFWYSGANIFWQPINYFPYQVEKLLGMDVFGNEFWVETNGNEIFNIAYPCQPNQICWEKSNNIPSSLPGRDNVIYKISSERCDNDYYFVYPLPHKIKMCITSIVMASDASSTTSLALTDDNRLWFWDRPAYGPYTLDSKYFLFTVSGTALGILIATFILKIIRI